jgi:parvulin-like peptidyl-prolyl isomerase
VSQVLRESAGFRIVKLLERESERPYEFAEIQNELRQLYRQEYMNDAYEEYIAGLREKFTVDVKE